jgi:hypothetical protein
MMFLKLCTAALLTGLCVTGVSGATNGAGSSELVSADLLAKADIETVWQVSLPLKSKERLGSIDALGDGVFALTTTNYLFGLSAAGGEMRFANRIAAQGLELLPLDWSGDELIVVTGSSMRMLDVKSGKEKRGPMKVPFGVVAKPATNDRFYYLAADDGKIYVYDANDRVLVFKAAADRGSLITNAVATNQYVVFTTDKGAIIAMEPSKPAQMWRYDASGSIGGRITLDGGSVYVSSMDTNVYKFDAMTGKIVWNYMAGSQLMEGPKVAASAVYQFAGDNGIYAIDKKTGKVLWREKDGRDLLAEQKGKTYLMSKNQSLIIVDNATGKRIGEVGLPGVDEWAAGVTEGMMYVGNAATGKIACLKPIDR